MKRKTFDNYDYEEAFPVELDRDIQKKQERILRRNTRCRFRTMKNSGKSSRRN